MGHGVSPAAEEPHSVRRRASTHDREIAAATLCAALSDGMLSVGEFDERSAAVAAAIYQDELDDATVDVAHVTQRRKSTGVGQLSRNLNVLAWSALLWANHHRRAAAVAMIVGLLMVTGLAVLVVGMDGDPGHREHLEHFEHDGM